MMDSNIAELRCEGRYTKFTGNNMTITFLHSKDLMKYLAVKEWDDGYLVVDCVGRIKGEYEDYIDLPFIMENLYMDPMECLKGIKEVKIANV